jgi:hypothetical protein
MRQIIAAMILLFAVGCQKESATQVEMKTAKLDEMFNLKAGETISMSGESLTFRFDSVLFDSRCPEGAECLWAGNAAVVISLPDKIDTVYLYATHTEGRYSITLQGLAPYPKINMPISKDLDTAKFIVSKN